MQRYNPYKMYAEDEVLREDREELVRVAKLAYRIHDQIWGGHYTGGEISEEISELLEAAEDGLGVFVGLSYPQTPTDSIDDVLSFLLAYEIPTSVEYLRNDPEAREGLAEYGLTPDSVERILRGRRVLYVANYSRLPTEEARKENDKMFKAVLAYAITEDFVITARSRIATSYKVLKRYAAKGYINFLFDFDLGDGYRQIVIEMNNKNALLRIARKFVLYGRILRELGRNYIFQGVSNLRKRIGSDK